MIFNKEKYIGEYKRPARKIYPEEYSNLEMNRMRLVNFSEIDGVTPFGSYSYKLPYPGDIDLYENFTSGGGVKQLVDSFIVKIKQIVNSFIKNKGANDYIVEFKIGLDMRYDINVGTLYETVFTPNPQLVFKVRKLFREGLLSKQEYNDINETLEINGNNSVGYDIIYTIFREHRIIRWRLEDLKRGYVILPKNKKMTLFEALMFKTDVKIDIVTQLDGKFIEISNFIHLTLDNGDNYPKYVVNLGFLYDSSEMITENKFNLRSQVEKLFYSEIFFNPMKGVKRMFSLAQAFDDYAMLDKVTPILTSSLGYFYQLKSQIDSMDYIYETYADKSPFDEFAKELYSIKDNLSQIRDIDNDEIKIIQDDIEVLAILAEESSLDIGEQFKHVSSQFAKILNNKVMEYLIKHNLYPISCYYMPAVLSYTDHCKYSPSDGKIDIEDLKTSYGFSDNEPLTRIVHQTPRELLPLSIGENYDPILAEQRRIEEEQRLEQQEIDRIKQQESIQEEDRIIQEYAQQEQQGAVQDEDRIIQEQQTQQQNVPTYEEKPSFWKKVAKYLGYGALGAAGVAAAYFGVKGIKNIWDQYKPIDKEYIEELQQTLSSIKPRSGESQEDALERIRAKYNIVKGKPVSRRYQDVLQRKENEKMLKTSREFKKRYPGINPEINFPTSTIRPRHKDSSQILELETYPKPLKTKASKTVLFSEEMPSKYKIPMGFIDLLDPYQTKEEKETQEIMRQLDEDEDEKEKRELTMEELEEREALKNLDEKEKEYLRLIEQKAIELPDVDVEDLKRYVDGDLEYKRRIEESKKAEKRMETEEMMERRIQDVIQENLEYDPSYTREDAIEAIRFEDDLDRKLQQKQRKEKKKRREFK
jgi:hypothetical protein